MPVRSKRIDRSAQPSLDKESGTNNARASGDRHPASTLERRLTLLANHCGDAIVLFDRAFRIEWANRAFVQLTGFECEEVKGDTLARFYGRDTDEMVAEQLGATLQEGRIARARILIYDKSAQPVWIDLTLSPILEAKAPAGYVGTARDITEQVHIEHALIVAREQAEAASQAKSEFLGAISHELRTPLNAVIGMTSLLLETQLDEEQRESAGIVLESGKHQLHLIEELLDLTRVEAGHIKITNVSCLLSELSQAIATIWRPRLHAKGLKFDYCERDIIEQSILCDVHLVRQVVNNLLNNAEKFTETGKVSLTTSQSLDGWGRVQTEFVVTDTGIGIAEDHLELIFDKFWQVDGSRSRKYQGAGLGLALTKGLIERMGGTISVTSKLREGSVFSVKIPTEVSGAHVNESQRPQGRVEASPSAQRHVLLTEDNPINQAVMSKMLALSGYSHKVAANGLEALTAIGAEHFDIVLMDIQMPVMDGIQAIRHIRSLTGEASRLPIICVTANAMKGDRERYLECGANGYLAKPIDRLQLVEAIESLLDGAERRAQA